MSDKSITKKSLFDRISKEEYRDNLKSLMLFFILFLILQSLISIAYIPSGSMEPTLHVGKRYIFSKCAFLFSEPKRGDIIIFDDSGTVYCKRIIGEPNDTIDLIDGAVYINGELLEEEYANGKTYAYSQAHYEVPEGCYFFMGDNRENSRDSRLWDYPFLKKEKILGKVITFKK